VNPCHDAPGNHAPALLRRLPRRDHPCRCATLCSMASNNPVALCHPLPYDRRAAPSKKDGGALEGKTNDYSTPAQDYAVTSGPVGAVTSVAIGPVRPSPPSRRHLGHCITIPDAVEACGERTPPRWLLCLVRPHVNGTLESSRGWPSNRRPLRRHPRSRSWTCAGHTMTPRHKQDSPGQPSTP
jgi:hypothetical protein